MFTNRQARTIALRSVETARNRKGEAWDIALSVAGVGLILCAIIAQIMGT